MATNADTLPYREKLDELLVLLAEHGNLGCILIDLSQLCQVERNYGSKAFEKVLDSATEIISKLKGSEVRASDIMATNDRGGDAVLIFLSPRRSGHTVHLSQLQTAAQRIEIHVNGKLARRASPYLHQRLNVTVGFALVLNNPLMMPERLIARLVRDSQDCVRFQRLKRSYESRYQLQEILINEEVRTFFQPIKNMKNEEVLGYEALSRGPEGSALVSPANLFETAVESDLGFELDRLCRQRALVNARGLPESAKLFVNVMPSALYDPEFQGSNLIRVLDELGLSPKQVVIELTEKYAIENYSMFVDAISNFTQMGFAIAVDDIGAGHSGLEKIANINPQFLKFDMDLVREIDTSYTRREIVAALKNLGDKMDAVIIAEGIERQEELETLLDLGIDYGQGFLLGRPAPMFAQLETMEASESKEAPVTIGQIEPVQTLAPSSE
jgi:EAL domain-containing protein (putative c-di-GMP-specific phosphodiesterase class I)